MLCTKFAPNFSVDIDTTNLWLIFTDSDNNFKSVYNIDTVAKAAEDGFIVQPHCGHVVNNGDYLIPIVPALNFETSLARLSGKPSNLITEDWHQVRSSHATGDGDRFYISVGGERQQRGLLDGLASIKSRMTDQENRPVAWWPFSFTYNGYYGTLNSNGTSWKYDNAMLNGVPDQANGWDILDPAHLESAVPFYGAALGDRQCLANFFMLAAWVYSTFPGGGPYAGKVQQGWHGSDQERARGWRYWFDARAMLLGLDTADQDAINTFFAGQKPKQHAVAILNDALTNPQSIAANHPDDRTMVDFKDGSGEIKGAYGWANGIMFAGWGYLKRAGIINDPLKTNMDTWMTSRANDVIVRSVNPSGLSYAFSGSTDFTQADCDKANLLETDKGHFYQLVDFGSGVGVIQDAPRKQDSELMAAGLSLLFTPFHPIALMLLAVCDKIGTPAYDNRARYLDILYGQVL